ncbi:MAG: hypothetical protein ACOZB3_03260 [Calditrichota bacterium]
MKASYLVLLFELAGVVWGQPPVPNDSVAANQFVWTDSLIANRGPFATPPPPESFKPDTIDGKLYWHGGVFVLPGTPDSVLLANGFRDVVKKSGSVMHDYFEATWPINKDLNTLPLTIRQVRYGVYPMFYPINEEWKRILNSTRERACYEIDLFVIPNLPDAFFDAYGITQYLKNTHGWVASHFACWPTDLPVTNAPPEFYEIRALPVFELE